MYPHHDHHLPRNHKPGATEARMWDSITPVLTAGPDPRLQHWHDAGCAGRSGSSWEAAAWGTLPAPSLVGTLRETLRGIGARSCWLPLVAMAIGAAVPALSQAMQPIALWLMAATVFCGFMAIEQQARPGADQCRAAIGLPFATLGAALLAWLAGHALGAGAEAAAWMALVAAAPLASITVVHAGSLGLPTRPIAHLAILSTLAAPAVLPLVALVFATGQEGISSIAVAMRVIPAVMVPATLALLLALAPPLTDGRVMARADWRGLSTAALCGLAMARIHGVVPLAAAQPELALYLTTLGLAAAGAGTLAMLAIGWPGGWRGAALAGGLRNAALVWAVTLPMLPAEGQLFMALTLVPAYGVPLLVRLLSQVRVPMPVPALLAGRVAA
jgi:hypothetical protein